MEEKNFHHSFFSRYVYQSISFSFREKKFYFNEILDYECHQGKNRKKHHLFSFIFMIFFRAKIRKKKKIEKKSNNFDMSYTIISCVCVCLKYRCLFGTSAADIVILYSVMTTVGFTAKNGKQNFR